MALVGNVGEGSLGRWFAATLGGCRETASSSISIGFCPPCRSCCTSRLSSTGFSSDIFSCTWTDRCFSFVVVGSWEGSSRSVFTSGVTSVSFSSAVGPGTGKSSVCFSSFVGSKILGDGYAGGSPKKSRDCSGTENLNPEQENEILYQFTMSFPDHRGTLVTTHR